MSKLFVSGVIIWFLPGVKRTKCSRARNYSCAGSNCIKYALNKKLKLVSLYKVKITLSLRSIFAARACYEKLVLV